SCLLLAKTLHLYCLLNGCPIEMENTMKVLCLALRRICNVKRGLRLSKVRMIRAPNTQHSIITQG
ncbi:MAG: hypothetical protein ACR2KX_12585, partial [Chitinophagaceae bacterium]